MLNVVRLCFLLSGATSLVLEVVWSKALSYALGVSVHATATVVAAFMFGLAAGSALASRFRRGRPPSFPLRLDAAALRLDFCAPRSAPMLMSLWQCGHSMLPT